MGKSYIAPYCFKMYMQDSEEGRSRFRVVARPQKGKMTIAFPLETTIRATSLPCHEAIFVWTEQSLLGLQDLGKLVLGAMRGELSQAIADEIRKVLLDG